jgi:hypothetical protein
MARMRSTVSQALRALPTAASVPCGGSLLPYPSEPLHCYCAVAVTAERRRGSDDLFQSVNVIAFLSSVSVGRTLGAGLLS